MRDVRKIVRIVSCIMKRFLKLIIKKLYHWRIIIILLEIKITWRLWRKCWKSWERKIKINWRKMMKKKHWKIEGSFKDHERYGLESQYEINMNCQQLSRKFPNLHNQQSIFKTFNSRMHQSLPEIHTCVSILLGGIVSTNQTNPWSNHRPMNEASPLVNDALVTVHSPSLTDQVASSPLQPIQSLYRRLFNAYRGGCKSRRAASCVEPSRSVR